MHASTARRLLQLNRDFYARFAAEFAQSRTVLQPGILRALERLGDVASLLDVGCGDGRVGRALLADATRTLERYVGVDFSAELLARATMPGADDAASGSHRGLLIQADVTSPDWARRAGLERPFAAAVCFSLLPQIPGEDRRRRLLADIGSFLPSQGRLALSTFCFLRLPRFERKLASWDEIGFSPAQVDAGDYLLDWRRGGRGLRYYHHFEEDELAALCVQAGYRVRETFRSDGETGDLGLFAILERG